MIYQKEDLLMINHDAILTIFNSSKSPDDLMKKLHSKSGYSIVSKGLAKSILSDRVKRNQKLFTHINEIDSVRGMGPKTFEKLLNAFEEYSSKNEPDVSTDEIRSEEEALYFFNTVSTIQEIQTRILIAPVESHHPKSHRGSHHHHKKHGHHKNTHSHKAIPDHVAKHILSIREKSTEDTIKSFHEVRCVHGMNADILRNIHYSFSAHIKLDDLDQLSQLVGTENYIQHLPSQAGTLTDGILVYLKKIPASATTSYETTELILKSPSETTFLKGALPIKEIQYHFEIRTYNDPFKEEISMTMRGVLITNDVAIPITIQPKDEV